MISVAPSNGEAARVGLWIFQTQQREIVLRSASVSSNSAPEVRLRRREFRHDGKGFLTRDEVRDVYDIPVIALGLSLSAFLVVSYVLCVLFDLWLPAQAMNPVWSPLLPGFTWLTWPSKA